MSVFALLATATILRAVGYFALAGFVWRHRAVRGAREATLLLVGLGWWTVFYALELTSHDVPAARLWSTVEFVGVVALPPALWAFVRRYVGRARLSPRTWALLSVEPLVVLGLLISPATRDLVLYYPTNPALLRHLGSAPVAEAGPLFWPHAIYSYVLLLAGVGVLTARLLRVARPYRRSAFALVAAAVLPLLGNLAYNLPSLGLAIDPTPFLFTLTAVVFVWGLLRPRLLDVPAVSRNLVVEQLADGVLLLDLWGRVVDANPASADLAGVERAALIGRALEDVMPAVAVAVAACPTQGVTKLDQPIRVESRTCGPDTVGAHRTRDLSITVTGLTDHTGRPNARIVLIRDVSDRVRDVAQLRDLLAERTAIMDTLQRSLRPDRLPELPRLEMAARWVPADTVATVSGDFYDVHPAGPDAWAFVLGDVSGKGVHAAVVTSTARHTVRALSALGWAPSAVLTQLNRALLAGGDPERFCTVAYGRICVPPAIAPTRPPTPDPGAAGEPGTGIPAAEGLTTGSSATGDPVDSSPAPPSPTRDCGGVRVTLSLGGHPQPMLRLATGGLRQVGRPGTALGLLPAVEVSDTCVDLASGDVLLVYTDGVTEGRRGNEQFGETRLAAALDDAVRAVQNRTGPDAGICPTARVDSIADLLLGRISDYCGHQDDVALLLIHAS